MIELGKVQTLTVVKKVDFGIYLSDPTELKSENATEVLLPMKEVPSDVEIHDALEVFIYKDSEDRIIATMHKPIISIGEGATLRVKDIAPMGAFLDWGLDKDLLLPFKEQKGSVKKGDMVPVLLYVDKSDRLCATMHMNNQDKALIQMKTDALKLLGMIERCGGELPLSDKSAPELIRQKTGMSKNEFKKAAGILYKQRKILIEEGRIRLTR